MASDLERIGSAGRDRQSSRQHRVSPLYARHQYSCQYYQWVVGVSNAMCSILTFRSLVIRANLVQAKVCGRGWAMFWAALFPFLVCIPLQVRFESLRLPDFIFDSVLLFQTSDSLNTFFSWASLITSSLANFITPFLIYIFLKNRKSGEIATCLFPISLALTSIRTFDQTSLS